MLNTRHQSLILILFLVFSHSFSFDTEWELKQFGDIENNAYYVSLVFNSTEEVLKDARYMTKQFMENSGAQIPGVVIGLSIKGKTVWNEGFGQIDIENNVTTDRNSVWRLASISKPLTSALVGQLIDRGLLDLNASIHEYISEDLFPRKTFNGKPVNITVRQVLSHTAGLHVTKLDDFDKIFKAHNVSQTIPVFSKEQLLYKPGTEFNYSNYGFQMVGALIEAVLKNSYQSEIQKMFLKLKMNSTFAETRGRVFKHRPRYYTSSPPNIRPFYLENVDILDDLFSYEGWWPSGGMVSTVEDLLTFGNAMLSASKGKTKDFLSQSVVKELWKPETIGLPKAQVFNDNEYGKGWCIKHIAQSVNYPYKTLIWHSGGLLGTSTILFLFPDQEMVGVAFANRGSVIGLDNLVLSVAQNFKDFIY